MKKIIMTMILSNILLAQDIDLIKACETNDLKACSELAKKYVDHLYIKKDNNQKALVYYTQACEGGLYSSCTDLGYLYRMDHRGTLGIKSRQERNEKASNLFKKACNGGDKKGCDLYKLSKSF